MYKLNGHSLSKGAAILPESQSFNIQERDSTSSVQLGPESERISFGDWILDDGWPEGSYVWRVKTLGEQVNTDTGTVELEHIIKTLDDFKLHEDITTEDMGGSGASEVSARTAIETLLSYQNHWVLGAFEFSASNPYEFNTGDSLLDGIESVCDTLEEATWDYDLTVYPFRLNIRRRDDHVSCEMRAGRNLSTLKTSLTRSGMYTRIYPIGKNDLRLTESYLSRNENLYGRIDKVETNQGKSTEAALRAWAGGRLRKHSEPVMTITISGLELSGETGESLDALRINKTCRCPLPNSGTSIVERITKLQWRDRRKEPENVTVNLCNNVTDVESILKESSKSGGSAAAGQAKQNYLFEANGEHLYYEVFDDCGHLHSVLEMTTESLRIAFDNLIESTRSEFLMTSESLRITFENEIASTRSQFEMTSESMRIQFENEIASTRSQLEMTSESLRVQFENDLSSTRSEFQMTSESLRIAFQNADASLRSEFNLTAESLRIAFQNADASLRSSIEAEAGRIGLLVEGYGNNAEVKRASIILAINNGTSSAHIDADEVYIGNQKSTTVINGKCVLSDVTADYIAGKIATIPTLSGITASFSGNITSGGALSGNQVYADSRNISNPVMYVALLGPTNNVYTLVATKADGTYNEMPFSRAVSSWTMGWSGGKFTAKANPQNQSCDTTLVQGTTSWDGNVATVPVNAYDSDNPNYTYATGRSVVVDASSIYSAGRTDGVNAAKPVSGTAGGRTSGVSALVHDFTITKGDGSTVTLQIDVSSIYTTARSGYTLGTFTPADITLQGDADNVYKEVSSGGTNYYTAGSAKNDRGDSVTAREVLSSGGTVYYTAGTATTYYDAGTAGTYYDAGSAVTVYPGNGGSFTPQGSAGPRLKDDGAARHYDVNGNLIGNHHWYHAVSSGGTQYYNAGSGTKYARGTGYSITPIGTAHSITPVGAGHVVTPIGSTSVRLGSAGTYYKGNGGSFTPVSGSPKMLAATTRYKAGTRYQSTYYTKS